jgi:hypothetical protein
MTAARIDTASLAGSVSLISTPVRTGKLWQTGSPKANVRLWEYVTQPEQKRS